MKETRILLQKAIANAENYIATFAGDTNPQIIVMVIQARAERDAFQAVLDSLNKSNAILRTYTGER